MGKTFNCRKCGAFLGEMTQGKIRNGSVLLCTACWERADLAIQMADMASKQGKEFFKGNDSKVVDDLMGMFGMKK